MKYNALTNRLTVLKKNGLCSIQDLGRLNAQHLGFTAGGAADEYAYLAANLIANNYEKNTLNIQCAALEITLGQLTIKAHQNCTIAITGADCKATINDFPIKNWQAHQLNNNDVLRFFTPKKGLHSYLAVHGGIQSQAWLGSQSQSFSERIGTEQLLSFASPSIEIKSEISLASVCTTSIDTPAGSTIKQQKLSNSFYDSTINYTSENPLILRFLPQALWQTLTKKQQQQLSEHCFNITPQSNRMGYRLSSLSADILKSLASQSFSSRPSQLSRPVTYGTIQLPSNGQPIVLMKERQTIGGYPVLGCVIQTDLFKLSQLRPGECVRFVPTTLAFAQQQLLAMYKRFNR